MRKVLVASSFMVFIIGIYISFYMPTEYSVEVVAYEWDPINPPELHPTNATYLAFIAITETQSVREKFPNLMGVTALQLNFSASYPVRVRVGKLTASEPPTLNPVTFDKSDVAFHDRIQISGTNADILEIKNENMDVSVNIEGSVKVIGEVPQIKYPYSGVGTLIALLGLVSLIYGLITKPREELRKTTR